MHVLKYPPLAVMWWRWYPCQLSSDCCPEEHPNDNQIAKKIQALCQSSQQDPRNRNKGYAQFCSFGLHPCFHRLRRPGTFVLRQTSSIWILVLKLAIKRPIYWFPYHVLPSYPTSNSVVLCGHLATWQDQIHCPIKKRLGYWTRLPTRDGSDAGSSQSDTCCPLQFCYRRNPLNDNIVL